MSVSFNNIGPWRYPGVYIEIDGSQAGLGGDLPIVLLVGQKLAAGTAAAGEVTLLSSVDDAVEKFGPGSMLAQMAASYRAVDSTFDLYALPYADSVAGVAATGSVTLSGVPTAAGTLSLYIAGRVVQVAVANGQAASTIASALAAAITVADDPFPVTATANGATVTLTARHKGTCGNAIDLRLSLYGERTPAGLLVTTTAMAGGSGDPLPGDLASMLGQRWYRYVALGINDAATMAAWHAESQRRYKPPIQAGFRAFTAYRGDYAAAVSYGSAANYEHLCALALEFNPTSAWEAAAIVTAAAAPKLYNNPVESLEGTPLPGMVGVSYFDWTNANSLLFKGMSVFEYGRDGSCAIKRLVSMYQARSDGSADDAFLDINTAEAMERVRYEQRIGAIKRFRGSAAARNPEGFRPGLRITTTDDVRAFLLSLYRNVLMREFGWVQEYEYYKSTLVVEQDPTNPSRFNFRDEPILLSPFYMVAGRAMFRKAVPAY